MWLFLQKQAARAVHRGGGPWERLWELNNTILARKIMIVLWPWKKKKVCQTIILAAICKPMEKWKNKTNTIILFPFLCTPSLWQDDVSAPIPLRAAEDNGMWAEAIQFSEHFSELALGSPSLFSVPGGATLHSGKETGCGTELRTTPRAPARWTRKNYLVF